MKGVKSIFIMVVVSFCLIGTSGCKGKSGQGGASDKIESQTTLRATLFDKSLPEIKEFVDGKWELIVVCGWMSSSAHRVCYWVKYLSSAQRDGLLSMYCQIRR